MHMSGTVLRFVFAFIALLAPIGLATATGADHTFTAVAQTLVVNPGSDISASIEINGAFTGGRFVFEASPDGTNWKELSTRRSNSDVRETDSGVLASAPAYYWLAAFGPVQKVRVRCTALSSGSAYAIIQTIDKDVSLLFPGPQGTAGATGATGSQGPAGVNAFGTPNSRTLSLATAYQATDNAKPAFVVVNLQATPSLTLGGGSTNTADVVMGATNAVASGAGSQVGKFNQSLTGTIVIGVAVNAAGITTVPIALPAGWWFAIRQTGGTVAIVNAFDQSVG
jgi:hypothetical protein